MRRRRWVMPGHGGPGNEPPLLTEKLPGFLQGVHMEVKKKLFTAIISALLVFLNDTFNLGVDEATIQNIVLIIVAFIIGQGIADHGKERARIEAGR